MSQQTSGHAPATPAGSAAGTPTTQVARDEAAQLGQSTADAGKQVAGTAKEQAGEVAREARRQAKDLLGEARGQATEQARNGQQKATEGLRALADELHQMADGGDQHGPASDLAKQAAERLGDAAEWLSRREPGDLIEEFRTMARRRPGAFLVGAAIAGILAGRLTRGAVDANRDTSGSGGEHARGYPPVPTPRAAPLPPQGYPAGPSTAVPYETPVPYESPVPYDAPPAYAPPPRPYDVPGGGYPAGGAGDPTTPRPYAPGSTPPGPSYSTPGYPPDRQTPAYPPPGYQQGPDYGQAPETAAPTTGPAHAPRSGATTVGEYVEELERGAPSRYEDPRYPDSTSPSDTRSTDPQGDRR